MPCDKFALENLSLYCLKVTFTFPECPMLCEKCHQVDVEGELVLSCDDCSDGYGTSEYICAGNMSTVSALFCLASLCLLHNYVSQNKKLEIMLL